MRYPEAVAFLRIEKEQMKVKLWYFFECVTVPIRQLLTMPYYPCCNGDRLLKRILEKTCQKIL